METILRFYRDLKRYTDMEIRKMAKHAGLNGRPDDLRWMLAIKKLTSKSGDATCTSCNRINGR